MGESGKGHWTRTHTKSGKDVLFWISDQEQPTFKLGDTGTPAVYLQKQKKRKRK